MSRQPSTLFRNACLAAIAVLAVAFLFFNRRPEARKYGYRVVHAYPHNPSSFTQGLEYRDGILYEGTGLTGHSSLRKETLETGEAIAAVPLAPELFGEGITVLDGRVIQVTWQSHLGFVYDQATLKQTGAFNYPGEGWGLANDSRNVYLSDGSSRIRVLDPHTFREIRAIEVNDGGRPIPLLNELEWVEGEIYANVWHSDAIARISPASGAVLGWIDLAGLLPGAEKSSDEAVLNGIAYDAAHKRLFVTGKLWPKLFEIQAITGTDWFRN